ncbi:asparagine synthetase B family protein [Marinifilum flexuosum]|uniref:asparagine synthetase B family protein n=1 Tax=Marinifilum flexuosum TaxID=1117708 RepID=UPI0024923BFF|nr:asparagine synthetase B family protein [Marinifilum flexuosum]
MSKLYDFIGTFTVSDSILKYYKSELNKETCNNYIASHNSKNFELEDCSISFHGRLYDWKQYGYNSEAETLLNLYLKNGKDSLKQLDGEFTFFIQTRDLFFAYRDRHGAGPQFFYTREFFSSHLFELVKIDGVEKRPNLKALSQFLSIGYIPSPQTSIKGVKKLSAGSYIEIINGKLNKGDLFTYDSYSKAYGSTKLSLEEAVEEYQRLHKEAIQSRINGNATIGLLMSGGYDSAGNIGALREFHHGDVKTFSIGFKDNPWTELPLAKILAKRFDAEHKEYEIDGSEINALPQILKCIGDPFQEGGLMVNFMAMQLIGDDKPDIILGGDGNDQHHGTAGKELALHFKLKKMGLKPVQQIAAKVLAGKSFQKDNKFFRAGFHNEKILNIMKSDNFGFSLQELKNLLMSPVFIGKHEYLKPVPCKFSGFDDFFVAHNYFCDIKQVVNEVILFKASRMADLYENQLTFPYMSTNMYNFLETLPVELKFNGSVNDLAKGKGVSKYLHKTYLKPKLPEEITNRKKQGGFAPLPIFFKSEKNRKLFSQIIRKSEITGLFFKESEIDTFLKEYDSHLQKPAYWFWFTQVKAFQYFNLLMLTVWWEMMVNGKDINSLEDLK